MKKTTTAALRTLHYAALTLAFTVAGPARAETANCTPITSVPYVITIQGVYCFTDNIATAISSGVAISIQTNNVTIDLNGFKLGGLAAGPGTLAYGISAFARQNITIRNGIVRGFLVGIWLDDVSPYTTSQGHLLEDLIVDQNTVVGLDVRGRGCVVRRNQVVATGGSASGTDAYGIYVAGPSNDVLNNRVAGTTETDFSFGLYLTAGNGSVVEGNRFGGDTLGLVAYGIYIESSADVLVAGNRVTTTDYGIYYSASSGKYMDNLTSGVATPFTGGTPVGTNN